jgi:hypothetical protein
MKLLIMQFSPTSCHLIFLRSKYSPQHPQATCRKLHASHFANITNLIRNATYIWGQIYTVYYSFSSWRDCLKTWLLLEIPKAKHENPFIIVVTRGADIFTDSDIRQLWLGLCPEPWHETSQDRKDPEPA